jgi:hypothetical protein
MSFWVRSLKYWLVIDAVCSLCCDAYKSNLVIARVDQLLELQPTHRKYIGTELTSNPPIAFKEQHRMLRC